MRNDLAAFLGVCRMLVACHIFLGDFHESHKKTRKVEPRGIILQIFIAHSKM